MPTKRDDSVPPLNIAPAKSYYMVSIYPRAAKLGDIRCSEIMPSEIKHDCRLQRTRLGEYYLIIPMEVTPSQSKSRDANGSPRIIALDPGVRTFLTGYDPSGNLIEMGVGDMTRVARLCVSLDKLQSKIDTPKNSFNSKKRGRLRKAAMRVRRRIRNLVDDVHKKVACFLTSQYDCLLLPTFETGAMVRKGQRRIRANTVRAMLTWAHYRFRQTLLHRARITNCVIELVTEEYTSKTCGSCGAVHSKLRGSKRFNCPNCGHKVDRDANAARNILLKNARSVEFKVERPPAIQVGGLSPGTSTC